MPEMKIVHNITLDMLKPRMEVVNVKQGANLTQWVHADLVVGGSAWTPPDGVTVEVRCKKPDRTCCLYSSEDSAESDAFIVSGSSVEVRLHAQTMTCAGKFPVDIAFKKGNETLPLFSFLLDVERQSATNGDIASGSYINGVLVNIRGHINMLEHDDPQTPAVNVVQNPETASFDFYFNIPYGEKGDNAEVTSVSYMYAQSTSGTSVPGSSSWSSSRPTPQSGRYMWTKMIITFNNDVADQRELITVVKNGSDGEGTAAPSDAYPLTDSGAVHGVVGSATTFARSDHRHQLNIPDSGTPTPIGTVGVHGSATTYARSDHSHKSQNETKTVTLPASTNQWILQESGLYKYTATHSTTGVPSNTFFVNTGYVYFVGPTFSSREAYSELGIVVAEVATNDTMEFYATSQPTTEIQVNITKMVSA